MALQANPDDYESVCMDRVNKSNAEIKLMFEDESYSTGSVNSGEFIDFAQVAAIALMDQFDQCGTNQYLMVLDSGLS